MSDYSQITTFTTKDGLTTGDPNKLVKGSEFDAEFAAIATAITSKYDSTDLASEAVAQAETSNTVLMTPLRVGNWADANAGIVGDLQALADPNADRILFWDDSAGAAAFLEVSTGLTLSGTTLTTNDAAIVHDSLSGFVANEHIDHSSVSITAGAGLTGGGTIAATRTIDVGAGTGIAVNANDVALAVNSLSVQTAAWQQDADYFVIWDNSASTHKKIGPGDIQLPNRNVSTSGNFASTDVGGIVYWTGTTGTLTMPTSIGQDDCFLVVVNSGSGTLTIAGSGVTINSANSLKDIPAGGMATLIRESSTVWFLGGSLE